MKKNGLFGIDLEIVIKCEFIGYNVFLFVKKCVKEVEDWGLEIIGIYRFCGFVRRKVQLREQFEKDLEGVDFLKDNVMDIYVVIGMWQILFYLKYFKKLVNKINIIKKFDEIFIQLNWMV